MRDDHASGPSGLDRSGRSTLADTGQSSGATQGSTPPSGGSAGSPAAAPPVIPDHELLCRIGRGSYGEVWLARNVVGTYRAVKIVYRNSFANERPFEREFKGIQKFEPISRSHESQVDILHIGRNGDCFYYVMELGDDASTRSNGRKDAAGIGKAVDLTSASRDSAAASFQFPASYVPRTLKSEKQQRGRLPFDECLEIGLALTTALAHLHKHGLVHRDIKPSNVIFVDGMPKLADIGLVTNADETVSFVGTEGFIPPEGPGSPQADIYGLGKVLYEVSTGKDRQDYPEPPTRLGEFEDREQMLELAQIIQKACARDLKERYRTAEAMQADLLLLKTGKSVRRTHHLEQRLRLMTRIGIGTVAVMVLGVVPYFLAIREARAAKTQAAKSQEVALVLEKMFSGIRPLVAKGRDTTLLLDLLDSTAAGLPRELKGQPDVEADLRMILAISYEQVGKLTNALAMAREARHLRQARFGRRNLGVADAWELIGVLNYEVSDFPAAEAAALQALQIRRGLLGNFNTNVATSLNNSGLAIFNQGRFAEAERRHREALAIRTRALGPDSLEVAKSLNNLAMVFIMQGDMPAAEEHYRRALVIFEARLPTDDPIIATILNNTANLLHRKGDLPEAERLHSRALEIRRKVFGPNNPIIAGSETQLARIRAARGDLDGAERLFRDSLEMEKSLGLGEHMLVADTLAGLAGVLARKGDFLHAEPLLADALRIRQKIFGPDSSDAADVLNSQGMLAAARLDLPGAERIFSRSLDMTRKAMGDQHQDLLSELWLLSWALCRQNKLDEAKPLQNQVGMLVSKHGPYGLNLVTTTIYEFADTLLSQGRYEDAEQLLREAHRHVHSGGASSWPLQRDALEHLARFYQAWSEAAPHPDRAAKAREWQEALEEFDEEAEEFVTL